MSATCLDVERFIEAITEKCVSFGPNPLLAFRRSGTCVAWVMARAVFSALRWGVPSRAAGTPRSLEEWCWWLPAVVGPNQSSSCQNDFCYEPRFR